MTRVQVIDELAKMISDIDLEHPVRAGIDGVDCSGKTTLKELTRVPFDAADIIASVQDLAKNHLLDVDVVHFRKAND